MEFVANEENAQRVLLFLSEGVLAEGSSSLQQLIRVLRRDEASGCDRLVCAYSEERGWSFGCAEQKSAPIAVQEALNEHEAITYRPGSTGRLRHEFPAMMLQLVRQLQSESVARATGAPREQTIPEGVPPSKGDAQ